MTKTGTAIRTLTLDEINEGAENQPCTNPHCRNGYIPCTQHTGEDCDWCHEGQEMCDCVM